jgi:aminoglycoside 6'-N-acetyltransferase I
MAEMQVFEVTRDRFVDWKRLRQDLYRGVDDRFHDDEMELIFSSDEAFAFLGYSDDGHVLSLVELSLRNIVDGCLGGPVGYIEGLYIEPGHRGRGLGKELASFAADWFRARGCRDMAADAEIDNVDSQRFIEALGFRETYRVVEYAMSLGQESQ